MAFQGFSEKTAEFLWGIRFNNQRSWFQEHKEDYLEHLYRPMQALGQQLHQQLLERYPDLQVNLKVTRIYRDVRRVKYGGPYKDHLWLSIEPPRDNREDWRGEPVLFFEISPEGYEYGFGYWGTPRDMERYRRSLKEKPEGLNKLVRALARQDTFLLTGESYKRPKGEAPKGLEDWFNRKGVMLTCRRGHDELSCSPELAETILEGFLQLMPVYFFFDRLKLEPPVTDRI